MNRGLWFSLLFFTLAIALVWWPDSPTNNQEQRTSIAREHPDYAAENIVIRRYDSSGQSTMKLEAAQVAHYSDAALTTLTSPRFSRQSSASPNWQGQAAHGVLKGKDQLSLSDDVVITAQSAHNQPPTTVETTFLAVDLATDQAATEAPVTIHHPQVTMTGVGLNADLKSERIVIENQVRAIYDAPR